MAVVCDATESVAEDGKVTEEQPLEGKVGRKRKAVQAFDPAKDGLNDTGR